ncbi:hypothetical protein OKW48_007455 [Paraburkholderia youngii]
MAMTICVSRLVAFAPTTIGSKRIRGVPAATVSPSLTNGMKPSPRSNTVSSPMCSSTCRPLSPVIVAAWHELWSCVTLPASGDSSSSEVGSIDTPSPTIFWAKTGSGTLSRGTSTPDSGAINSMR